MGIFDWLVETFGIKPRSPEWCNAKLEGLILKHIKLSDEIKKLKKELDYMKQHNYSVPKKFFDDYPFLTELIKG